MGHVEADPKSCEIMDDKPESRVPIQSFDLSLLIRSDLLCPMKKPEAYLPRWIDSNFIPVTDNLKYYFGLKEK